MFKIIYKIFRKRFIEEFIRETYADIPKDILEPSIEFMAKGRNKLEAFFRIHGYNTQRRALHDSKNAQLYQGMLIETKALLSLVMTGSHEPNEVVRKEKKKEESPDVMVSISEFKKNAKEYINKKPTK